MNSISIKDAMKKWHLTQAQAEQLDKMDDDADNGTKGMVKSQVLFLIWQNHIMRKVTKLITK